SVFILQVTSLPPPPPDSDPIPPHTFFNSSLESTSALPRFNSSNFIFFILISFLKFNNKTSRRCVFGNDTVSLRLSHKSIPVQTSPVFEPEKRPLYPTRDEYFIAPMLPSEKSNR